MSMISTGSMTSKTSLSNNLDYLQNDEYYGFDSNLIKNRNIHLMSPPNPALTFSFGSF